MFHIWNTVNGIRTPSIENAIFRWILLLYKMHIKTISCHEMLNFNFCFARHCKWKISGFGCVRHSPTNNNRSTITQSVDRYFVFHLNGYNFLLHCWNHTIIFHSPHTISGYQFRVWGVRDHENECNETHKMNIVRIIWSIFAIQFWFDSMTI